MNRKKIFALVMLIVTMVVLFTGWWIFLREDASKPEQEILFLYTMSDKRGTITRIIDNEGNKYLMKGCPFNENNREVVFSDVVLDKSKFEYAETLSKEDMLLFYKLFNKWNFENTNYELKTYGMIYDIDIDNRLYVVKNINDETNTCYLLCQFAKPTKCVEDYKYRKYINYLIQKDIFPAQGSTFE